MKMHMSHPCVCRDKSSLEKVFDYFSSSQDENGMKTMLPQDLLQAIVPTFPASKSTDIRAGYLEGERNEATAAQSNTRNEFFSYFDIDGDGKWAAAACASTRHMLDLWNVQGHTWVTHALSPAFAACRATPHSAPRPSTQASCRTWSFCWC